MARGARGGRGADGAAGLGARRLGGHQRHPYERRSVGRAAAPWGGGASPGGCPGLAHIVVDGCVLLLARAASAAVLVDGAAGWSARRAVRFLAAKRRCLWRRRPFVWPNGWLGRFPSSQTASMCGLVPPWCRMREAAWRSCSRRAGMATLRPGAPSGGILGWRGNLAADALASRGLRVEASTRARRVAALQALRVVHSILDAMETACLAAAHGPARSARQCCPRISQFVRLLGRGTVTPGQGGCMRSCMPSSRAADRGGRASRIRPLQFGWSPRTRESQE